jgi:hypothetical protein
VNHSLPSTQLDNGHGSEASNLTGRSVVSPCVCEPCAASADRFVATQRRTSMTWVISSGGVNAWVSASRFIPPGRTRTRRRTHKTRRNTSRFTVAARTIGVAAISAAASPTTCTRT